MRYPRHSSYPLYVQIRERLRSELAQMEPGDPIPTELELEKKFNVSRITVRRAVEELAAEGLLLRQQGRGTFVQKPKLTHELSRITSWTEQMKRLGYSPRTAHRKITLEQPLPHVAEALGLKADEKVVRVQRVRLSGREPISYMLNYLPEHLLPGILSRKIHGESLYEFLAAEYGLIPAMAVDTVGTRFASDEEQTALRLKGKSPVLTVRRINYLENGEPLELSVVSSRGDRYQYQVSVQGRGRYEAIDSLENILATSSAKR